MSGKIDVSDLLGKIIPLVQDQTKIGILINDSN